MTILVFGKDGQVGISLQQCFKDLKIAAIFLGRSDCDLSDPLKIRGVLNQYQPKIIINASAYTAVDKAESEGELANAINAVAPKIMANYIAKISKGIFVHFSTDYVFSGEKESPYLETDLTGPLGIYGMSKLEGERLIAKEFESIGIEKVLGIKPNKLPRYFILRTSWVYGSGANFIRTILRLAAEREQLKVISDQYGVPTSADWLAQLAIQFSGSHLESGIYHAVPDGQTTWHSLAVFVTEIARQAGEGIRVKAENIIPIPSSEYPLPAARPSNSRMNNSKLKKSLSEMAWTGNFPKWQTQVEEYVKDFVKKSLRS